jgi:plasmid maintenance system antidote protein VapI
VKFDPDYVVPPSEVFREWLETMGISLRIACAILPEQDRFVAESRLGSLLDGDTPLTTKIAAWLERVTEVRAGFWLAFEHNYRVGLAAGKHTIRRA